jgi:hypothetical protein
VFVLPGTQIGDGAVIGANSLVKGVIPPRSLAIGFPARVVSRDPDYPKVLSEEERLALFTGMVEEMIKYFTDSGIDCQRNGEAWLISKRSVCWWRRGGRHWTLMVFAGEPRESVPTRSAGRLDVFLSLSSIAIESRRKLDEVGTLWIDIANRERSRLSNDLGEEVILFLRRYGIRTLRSPRAA